MKKEHLIGIALFIFIMAAISGMIYFKQIKQIPVPDLIDYAPNVIEQGSYTGSEYKGNYVYGAAMNLAWNELSENIINDTIKLNTTDKNALETMNKLNKSIFTKKDLNEESYYVKSGYGQKTVDLINKESKEKFPSKSFQDLDVKLQDLDIISYAYFLKEVEYEIQFKEKNVSFKGENVKGFIANNEKQKGNIAVLYYENDDKFIVKLKLKDNNDELILAKGFDMSKPEKIVDEINKYNKDSLSIIKATDEFEMPNLHLDYRRDYNEMIYKYFANKGFEEYYIAKMFENIKFDMDFKGARVENEAVIIAEWGSMSNQDIIRRFILDKPFWVVMKRSDSQNPYFILGVNNTELMEK